MRHLVLLLIACQSKPEPGPAEPVDPPPTLTETGSSPGPDETGLPPTETAEPPVVPPPFSAPFLWQDITFDEAVDLGHVPSPLATVVPPGPVTLVEVADAAGLSTAVSAGNSHGVGAGFVDYDGDGWDDIVLVSGVYGGVAWPSQLWRNQGDGTFADTSAASGLAAILDARDGYSVAAADYDADGDVDLYVTTHPTDVLLQNQGDGTFVDFTAAAGAGGPPSTRDGGGSSKIGAFGDVDGDGWLDVVVASSTFDAHPPHAYLLRNQGDATFEDLTTASALAVSPEGNPCAVMWTDYDNDGDQDLKVWNDRGSPTANRSLLRNDGGVFTDVTVAMGLTGAVGNPMGIDGADVDRNDLLDYYVSDIGGNALYLQHPGFFADNAVASGVLGGYGWGLGFEDLNLDGWWDLFVAQEDDRPYLSFTHDGVDSPLTFTETAWTHPIKGTSGHNVAVAFADYDHDGRTDVLTAGTNGSRVDLWHNETDPGSNRWLHVRVGETPGTDERGGITGRVVVKVGDTVLWRDLTAGSSRASQNAHSVRFGLGAWSGAEWVAVLWPDGRQLVATNVPGDRELVLAP